MVGIILIGSIVIIAGIAIIISYQSKGKQVETFPYQRRRYLCNKEERNFFRYLVRSVSRDYLILTKVRYADLIVLQPSLGEREKIEAYEKIISRRADFVLVDRATTEIRVVIELFDGRMNNAKRVQHSLFVDKLFSEVRIPLLRIRLSENYHINDLKRAILDAEAMYLGGAQEEQTPLYRDMSQERHQRRVGHRDPRHRAHSLNKKSEQRAIPRAENADRAALEALPDRSMEGLPAATINERPSRIKVA